MNKNTMGAVKQRARRNYENANSESAKKQLKNHLEKYAERLQKEAEPAKIVRKSDRKESILIPAEQSKINKVQYRGPKKKKRKSRRK